MQFHIPGRPEDLPPFHTLWARAATLAALEAGGCENQHTYANAVVHHDDAGGNEWRLARIQGERGVLVGVDHECGLHLDFEGCDLYSGPGWLPWSWFTALENQREQGFVYWWDGSVWDRIDYPDGTENDGLDLLLTHLATAQEVVTRVLDFLDLDTSLGEGEEESFLVHHVLELAEKGTGSEEEWHQALNSVLVAAGRTSRYVNSKKAEFDVAAALAVARATGLPQGSDAETKTAENSRPKSWAPRPG